jgi:hypothetical protein
VRRLSSMRRPNLVATATDSRTLAESAANACPMTRSECPVPQDPLSNFAGLCKRWSETADFALRALSETAVNRDERRQLRPELRPLVVQSGQYGACVVVCPLSDLIAVGAGKALRHDEE